MGGIGYGIRENGKVNTLNPASYSAVDSLTFIFDAGVSLENVNYSYGKNKTNKKSSSFDYLTMQFRAWKNIGMIFMIRHWNMTEIKMIEHLIYLEIAQRCALTRLKSLRMTKVKRVSAICS